MSSDPFMGNEEPEENFLDNLEDPTLSIFDLGTMYGLNKKLTKKLNSGER